MRYRSYRFAVGVLIGAVFASFGRAPQVLAQSSFTLFESGQVRPLALSPDGTRLFAVNTGDNRLEIFAVSGSGLTKTGSVAVGMEPVAVAARTNGEVWVVNHLSDSVSIVDVNAVPPRVIRTLLVGDEPRDIVFGGPTANRAFITTARRGQNLPGSVLPLLTTEGTPRALVFVFDATALDDSLAGTPETVIELFGDTPRALAVKADGSVVYAAVFESGNQTTTVSEGAVCDDGNLNNNTPAGSCNVGSPAVTMPGGLPNPEKNIQNMNRPETGLIVRYNNTFNQWRDELNRNWNNAVRFDLPDLDVFAINANANPPVAMTGPSNELPHVGTVLFNMLVNPANNKVYVTNTEARNEVRFEGPGTPIGPTTVRGHLHEARVTVINGSTVSPRHLNKHIVYSTVPSPMGVKDDSLATPLGMALDGTTLYVAGFGSQRIGVYDTVKLENDTFHPETADGVGYIGLSSGGPTGMVLDGANDRLYVLTRFDNTISVVNTVTQTEEVGLKQPLYNPEPASVISGRPFLYDAYFTSSNGEASCSSCHVFGDFDSLAWDLGNPNDNLLDNQNPVRFNLFQNPDFHPMKGPMTTQSLRGMANAGPMHWRGDRTGGLDEPSAQPNGGAFDEDLAFKKFNVAFAGLLGRGGPLSGTEMQAFTDFILQVTYPPNPIRSLDDVLSPAESAGLAVYNTPGTDTVFSCNGCHVLNPAQGFFGTDGFTTFEMEPQMFKIPHLRNMYQKVGMFGMPDVPFFTDNDATQTGLQVRGFGFLHDGSVDTLFRFHSASVFNTTPTQNAQLEAFVLAYDSNLKPMVGQQVTATPDTVNLLPVETRLNLMEAQAAAGACDVVVKGNVGGLQRGWYRLPSGDYRSDRVGEGLMNSPTLRFLANTATQELTYTCVPPGAGERIGVDRDEDGYFDRDELDAGSDPADPLSIPAGLKMPLPAVKLQIKNELPDDESKNKILLVARSPNIMIPVPGSPSDPRCNLDPIGTVKATVTISGSSSLETYSTGLPCQNWRLLGNMLNPTGYKYIDPELNDGTTKKITWKDGKLLKISLQGRGVTTLDYDLQPGVNQGLVTVDFETPQLGHCVRCDDYNFHSGVDGLLFLGKNCPPPPGGCP